ncbi:MAG: hypothetical protein PHD70_01330 [Anaerostipes sp.]|jgi:hypothetical protein|nr:hypothetical protein [Anaerostipes sp.]MDD3745098.1 hypothetical protein [Anaerostipes sp.]
MEKMMYNPPASQGQFPYFYKTERSFFPRESGDFLFATKGGQ